MGSRTSHFPRKPKKGLADLPENIFEYNTKLDFLQVYGNPLGCVHGVPDSVTMLDFYGQWVTPPEPVTPRCPANCRP